MPLKARAVGRWRRFLLAVGAGAGGGAKPTARCASRTNVCWRATSRCKRSCWFRSVASSVAHHAPCDVLIVKTVDRTLLDVGAGHGALVDVDGRKVGVFKDTDGVIHAVNPRCTHMGCTVDWNDAERTWDCPCHGSRFDKFGAVFNGPSAEDLDKVS